MIIFAFSQRVSPVCANCSFDAATISPATAESVSKCVFPLKKNKFPIFSGLSILVLYNSPVLIFPEVTLNRDIFPTNGSAMVLNTNADTGSLGSHFLIISLLFPSTPLYSAYFVAIGTSLIIVSRNSFIPLPSNAQLVKTGIMSPDAIPADNPRLNSSSVNSSPLKYFSKSSSSVSAIASVSASFSDNCTTDVPNVFFKSSITFSTSTFSLSILFTRKNVGIPFSLQIFHAFSVPTCIPDDASTIITAASAALIPEYTSPTKSKYPGVSIKLILCLLYSTGTMDVLIE